MSVTSARLPRASRRLRERLRLQRRLRMGVGRLRSSWWSVGQSALGGAVAWEASVRLLHHPAPLFASVAAIVALSISQLGRLRRVVEIAVGVTLGVGLGDVVVGAIGRGAWQLGLVALVAMALALLLDGGVLIVNQAALQAVFVTALPPPVGGYLGRWQDALLGGAVALGVAFVLPADPRSAARGEIAEIVGTMVEALRGSVQAARHGDTDAAFAALELARGTEPLLEDWENAVRAGDEISRISPMRRHARAEVAASLRAMDPVDRTVRNLRVALRRMVTVTEEGARVDPPGVPEPLLRCLEEMAGALHTLPGALRDADGEGSRRTLAALSALAPKLDPHDLAYSLSSTVVVAQLRSAVVDLMAVTGASGSQARAVLPADS